MSTSSVMRRTVQRAAPSGGVLQTIAMIRCFSDGLRTWAAPGRGRSKSAASTPPCRYRAAILWTPAGVRRTSLATCGALRPWSSCNNAITRVVTRTCCRPFFSMLSTRSRSEARNRNGRGGRPVPWGAPPRCCVTYFIYSSRGRRPGPARQERSNPDARRMSRRTRSRRRITRMKPRCSALVTPSRAGRQEPRCPFPPSCAPRIRARTMP